MENERGNEQTTLVRICPTHSFPLVQEPLLGNSHDRRRQAARLGLAGDWKARVWSLFKMFQNGTPITGPGFEYLASGDFHKCKLHLSGKAGIKSNSVVQTKAAGNQHIIF